jgi:hypothetical protein
MSEQGTNMVRNVWFVTKHIMLIRSLELVFIKIWEIVITYMFWLMDEQAAVALAVGAVTRSVELLRLDLLRVASLGPPSLSAVSLSLSLSLCMCVWT